MSDPTGEDQPLSDSASSGLQAERPEEKYVPIDLLRTEHALRSRCQPNQEVIESYAESIAEDED
jgi:hypothetical protein